MEDEEIATIGEQFYEFSRLDDIERNGLITLWRSDYWMRQSKIIDDRNITMTDTGLLWWKYRKIEMNFEEWHEMLRELCVLKNLDLDLVEFGLTNCGIPGFTAVVVPQYRDYFDSYKPRNKMLF